MRVRPGEWNGEIEGETRGNEEGDGMDHGSEGGGELATWGSEVKMKGRVVVGED